MTGVILTKAKLLLTIATGCCLVGCDNRGNSMRETIAKALNVSPSNVLERIEIHGDIKAVTTKHPVSGEVHITLVRGNEIMLRIEPGGNFQNIAVAEAGKPTLLIHQTQEGIDVSRVILKEGGRKTLLNYDDEGGIEFRKDVEGD